MEQPADGVAVQHHRVVAQATLGVVTPIALDHLPAIVHESAIAQEQPRHVILEGNRRGLAHPYPDDAFALFDGE